MSRSTLQTVFACLLALVLGGAASAWHARSHRAPETGAATPPPPAGPAARPLDPAFVEAVKTEKGTKRWLRLVAASEQATVAEMPALIRLAGDDYATVRLLAARWAELDPHHMFQSLYAEMLLPENSPGALPLRYALTESLFETWTKKDAAAVLKALNELPNFSGRENLRMTVVNQLMKSDPGQGLQAMQDWHITNYYPDMKKLGEWAAKDPQAAVDAVLKLGTDHIGQEALRQVARGWAKTDPQGALQRAAALRPAARAALGGEAIAVWAEKDLSAAIDFAAGQENVAYRGALGQSLVRTWGKTDPAAALEWSQENLQGPARTEAIGVLVKSAAEKDINSAAQLVEGMEGGPAQNRAAASVFETWFGKKDQRDAAIAWLASLPSDEMRRNAFERVQWNWTWQDPDGARDFLAGPQGKLAPQSMVDQVARNQAAKNPETAMAWAAKLAPDQSASARPAILAAWISSRPEGAQDYVRKLPAGPERDNSIRTVTQNLVFQDPQRAATWFRSLPVADQKAVQPVLDQIEPARRATLDEALKKP